MCSLGRKSQRDPKNSRPPGPAKLKDAPWKKCMFSVVGYHSYREREGREKLPPGGLTKDPTQRYKVILILCLLSEAVTTLGETAKERSGSQWRISKGMNPMICGFQLAVNISESGTLRIFQKRMRNEGLGKKCP